MTTDNTTPAEDSNEGNAPRDRGMGVSESADSSGSQGGLASRSRLLLIGGLVAVVVIAGVVVVGSKAGGSRSGDLTCATTKVCSVGDTGPGGGKVFYDAGSAQSWGRYLEAAPAGWYGTAADPVEAWCQNTINVLVGATNTAIGTGKANTKTMYAQSTSPCRAARRAQDYAGTTNGGWFLPSQDEMVEFMKQRAIIGGLKSVEDFRNYTHQYWTSTNLSTTSGYQSQARGGNPIYGSVVSAGKDFTLSIRPIRAF
jgi:hypothetical protein